MGQALTAPFFNTARSGQTPEAPAWAFTVKPQVHGFIYGGAGCHLWWCKSPGMRVWAQEEIFQKCSPWISGIWAQEKKFEIQIQ